MPHESPCGADGIVAGRYRLLNEIDRGAMGIVYEARHLETGKRCALKLLLPEVASHAGGVQRFIKEARAIGALDSDHIVKIFDAGSDQRLEQPFIVMEFLAGSDLRKTLQQTRPLSEAAALKIALQAALGLSIAHRNGVVHRDIKPGNLILTPNDWGSLVVKIVDFGVAKFKAGELTQTLRSGGGLGLLGTPLYMSPEQFSKDLEVGPESDVWSLGVVLWEMLTGSPPFQALTLPALASLVSEQDLPSIRSRAPWVDPEVADIVGRALCRDPRGRFADADKLLTALEKVVDGRELHPAEIRAVERAPVSSFVTDTIALSPPMSGSKADVSAPLSERRTLRRAVAIGSAACVVCTLLLLPLLRLPKPRSLSTAAPVVKALVAPQARAVASAASAMTASDVATVPTSLIAPIPAANELGRRLGRKAATLTIGGRTTAKRSPTAVSSAAAAPSAAARSPALALDPDTGLILNTSEFKERAATQTSSAAKP